MERDFEQNAELIDLGTASAETKGINGQGDEVLGRKPTGLSDD